MLAISNYPVLHGHHILVSSKVQGKVQTLAMSSTNSMSLLIRYDLTLILLSTNLL
jgi:hypothetical protein